MAPFSTKARCSGCGEVMDPIPPYGHDLPPFNPVHRGHAGLNGIAVEKNRAGAADSFPATVLRPRQVSLIPQEIDQSILGMSHEPHYLLIHPELNQALPPSRHLPNKSETGQAGTIKPG